MDWSQTWPSQPPAPSAARTNSSEAVVTVGLRELMCSVSVPACGAAGGLDQGDLAVAGIDGADRTRAQRLRLERDDPRANAAEAADAVADMAADVEGELAGLEEARIERVHGGVARRVAVVDVAASARDRRTLDRA